MGEHILSISLLTLFMFFWLGVFWKWYNKFLQKIGFDEHVIRFAKRLFWTVMALIFWFTLINGELPNEFTLGHFAFALFIYSLYQTINSFAKPK